MNKIGFMQGRLSPIIENKIQCFPWDSWQEEFKTANNIGIDLMEWTLDQDNLYNNPLMNNKGQKFIKKLSSDFSVEILSLTGDCFMQEPFWKAEGEKSNSLKRDFISIIDACNVTGIKQIIMPLVDNGSIKNVKDENKLIDFLQDNQKYILKKKIQVVFESDYNPSKLDKFIKNFDETTFGINYDMGNSAFFGYDPAEELELYGRRIKNVHVKDRMLGGGTVPLGKGAVDFSNVFSELANINYFGNFILQTARAHDDDHQGIIVSYKNEIQDLINKFFRK